MICVTFTSKLEIPEDGNAVLDDVQVSYYHYLLRNRYNRGLISEQDLFTLFARDLAQMIRVRSHLYLQLNKVTC